MYLGLRNNTQLEVTHVIQMQHTPATLWVQCNFNLLGQQNNVNLIPYICGLDNSRNA